MTKKPLSDTFNRTRKAVREILEKPMKKDTQNHFGKANEMVVQETTKLSDFMRSSGKEKEAVMLDVAKEAVEDQREQMETTKSVEEVQDLYNKSTCAPDVDCDHSQCNEQETKSVEELADIMPIKRQYRTKFFSGTPFTTSEWVILWEEIEEHLTQAINQARRKAYGEGHTDGITASEVNNKDKINQAREEERERIASSLESLSNGKFSMDKDGCVYHFTDNSI